MPVQINTPKKLSCFKINTAETLGSAGYILSNQRDRTRMAQMLYKGHMLWLRDEKVYT